jgi:hypothetical protein
MKLFRSALFVAALGASLAASVTANAAPRLLFRGCAHWSMLPPGCLKMKATNGKTYQLLDVPPSFSTDTPLLVYATPGAEWGLCFAPTAHMKAFKQMPGKC